MAPELIKRQPTDQRLDIFSYAVTCFEMYTKRFPWDAALTIDAVLQHINKPPVQISTLIPAIDKQISAAIMKGLEANPDQRWQKVGDMVGEFRDAEQRLVRLAREAAAKAKGVPPTESAKPVEKKTAPALPAASTQPPASSARTPASGSPKSNSSVSNVKKGKRRPSDDDIDLNEMFGD